MLFRSAKFPFNPQSNVNASLDEVSQIFSPGQGLDQFSAKVNQLILLQGSQYVVNPSSAVTINPSFVRFMNVAKKVQSALFPGGGTQPTLTFSLTEIKTPGAPDAILNIDGQQLTAAGQNTSFHWISQPGSRITLISDQSSWTGPWSIFHFGYSGYSTQHPTGNRLEYRFPGQVNQVVQFEVDGSGAPLLNPGFMNQLRCVANVKKP